MSRLPPLNELYLKFDRVFDCPRSFYNEGCCVSVETERALLAAPREQLGEDVLSYPLSHYPGCFGTFEQVAYFVPRLIEILAESLYGFEYLISLWRIVGADQDRYQELGLWQPIIAAMNAVFQERTRTFAVQHFDKTACQAKGWGLEHYDISNGADIVEALLGDFFHPLLSPRPVAWENFFAQWAHDPNPHRVAHLLDVWKQNCEEHPTGYWTFPPNFKSQMEDAGYIAAVIERAAPVFPSIEETSPTWLNDLHRAIKKGSGNSA